MKIVLSLACISLVGAFCVGSVPVLAQADKKKHNPVAEDIMDHRTMAEAHRKAADCLEAGKPEKDCRAQLSKDCKGIGIGKHCGMKDRHKH